MRKFSRDATSFSKACFNGCHRTSRWKTSCSSVTEVSSATWRCIWPGRKRSRTFQFNALPSADVHPTPAFHNSPWSCQSQTESCCQASVDYITSGPTSQELLMGESTNEIAASQLFQDGTESMTHKFIRRLDKFLKNLLSQNQSLKKGLKSLRAKCNV